MSKDIFPNNSIDASLQIVFSSCNLKKANELFPDFLKSQIHLYSLYLFYLQSNNIKLNGTENTSKNEMIKFIWTSICLGMKSY